MFYQQNPLKSTAEVLSYPLDYSLLELLILLQASNMQKEPNSSTTPNLHNFQTQLFLGFADKEQTFQKPTLETSFVGGFPIWLQQPDKQHLLCNNVQACKGQTLTFLAQIFCPLESEKCYNRVLYVLFCEKCRRNFKCLKQQSDSKWTPSKDIPEKLVKTVSAEVYEIQSEMVLKKELNKLISKSKFEVEQEAIMEKEDDSDFDDDEKAVDLDVSNLNQNGRVIAENAEKSLSTKGKQTGNSSAEIEEISRKFEELNTNSDKNEVQKEIEEKIKKDYQFEQYKKVMKALDYPTMLYSNVAVPYNSMPLNPKHFCRHCNSKLELEVQITEKILLLNRNLALQDWGSLMIYTCTNTCKDSEEECLVVQYETDAISEEEIAKLKKKKKNRHKNKKRNESKSRSKSKEKSQTNSKQKSNFEGQQIEEVAQKHQSENSEGDWD